MVVGPSPTGGATIFKEGPISERSVSTRVLVPVLVQNVDKALAEFWEYCVVAERLTERVSGDYRQIAKRLLKFANGMVSEKTIRDYLATYLSKAPKT